MKNVFTLAYVINNLSIKRHPSIPALVLLYLSEDTLYTHSQCDCTYQKTPLYTRPSATVSIRRHLSLPAPVRLYLSEDTPPMIHFNPATSTSVSKDHTYIRPSQTWTIGVHTTSAANKSETILCMYDVLTLNITCSRLFHFHIYM